MFHIIIFDFWIGCRWEGKEDQRADICCTEAVQVSRRQCGVVRRESQQQGALCCCSGRVSSLQATRWTRCSEVYIWINSVDHFLLLFFLQVLLSPLTRQIPFQLDSIETNFHGNKEIFMLWHFQKIKRVYYWSIDNFIKVVFASIWCCSGILRYIIVSAEKQIGIHVPTLSRKMTVKFLHAIILLKSLVFMQKY